MRGPPGIADVRAWVALGALLVPGVAGGQRASLAQRIDSVVSRPAFASALWGIEVRTLKSGRVIYSRNAEKNLKPASTMKLITTAAVLDAFGPDMRIDTTVESAGRLDSMGRILGDVFIVGRGDPELAERSSEGPPLRDLEGLATALKDAGIRRIEGRLVGHEGLFKGDRRGDDWSWGDLVWCYGAEVSALSLNDNCADLAVFPGELPGDPLLVERNPVSSFYSLSSSATTSPAGTKSDLKLSRDAGSEMIILSGTHPLGEKPANLRVALEDPARYAATIFHEVLEAKGIHTTGQVATSSEPLPTGVRVLASHQSRPLSEILKGVNKPSQNLHAEMLLRLLGARVKGEGTVEAGHDAVRDFLRRSGVPCEGWALRDGSGLSRSDILAPHDVVSLLAAMDRHPSGPVFKDSLPVAGVDGTLKNRMKQSRAEGRVIAKTGSLRHVSSLAGYATTLGGERLAFAIYLNHSTLPPREAVSALDEITEALVGS